MKRQPGEPKPFYKASHKAWYVQKDGKQHRLAAQFIPQPLADDRQQLTNESIVGGDELFAGYDTMRRQLSGRSPRDTANFGHWHLRQQVATFLVRVDDAHTERFAGVRAKCCVFVGAMPTLTGTPTRSTMAVCKLRGSI
jgi:hypothetical protein